MVKYIPLSNSGFAAVDDEDYDKLTIHSWQWHRNRDGLAYAVRTIIENGKKIMIPMHREIMNAPKGYFVDHINSNGMDNRRSNLRLCSPEENLFNTRKYRSYKGQQCGSKYKGVHWHNMSKKWQAMITINGKKKYLGLFSNEEAAARAYDTAAQRYRGNMARLNFPKTDG